MKELTVFEHNHVDVVDSRQVAEMVGKNHKDLMRNIREYVETLDRSIERNFAPNDFFIESTYKDSIGRTLPCYLLTKKGCDMVANKMTGEIVNGGVSVRNGGCCYLNRDFVSYRDALEAAEDVANNYTKYAKEWRV